MGGPTAKGERQPGESTAEYPGEGSQGRAMLPKACPGCSQAWGATPWGRKEGVDGGSLGLSSCAGGEQAPVVRTSSPP